MQFTTPAAAAALLLASSIVEAYATDRIVAGEFVARDAALGDLCLRSAVQRRGQRVNFARHALAEADAYAEAEDKLHELVGLVRRAAIAEAEAEADPEAKIDVSVHDLRLMTRSTAKHSSPQIKKGFKKVGQWFKKHGGDIVKGAIKVGKVAAKAIAMRDADAGVYGDHEELLRLYARATAADAESNGDEDHQISLYAREALAEADAEALGEIMVRAALPAPNAKVNIKNGLKHADHWVHDHQEQILHGVETAGQVASALHHRDADDSVFLELHTRAAEAEADPEAWIETYELDF